MALYHFCVKQIQRSAGQSAIASAAYRAGEKLHSDYYGEDSDYSRKGGVVHQEILLPDHAPRAYADRQTLWNAVENVEKNKRAQLAYSFDIALQNELTAAENLALARRFLQEQFVSRGMIADFAIHDPDRDGGIKNPHFHVMCPIRPLNPDGSWGAKQHRDYLLDENGERVRDEKGKYVFNAVPTTDWGRPETLEAWRKAWCDLCNEAFAQKGLAERVDNRSYVRQGLDLIPTEHEGPIVRQMESRGIPTEKGERNRWIKATNALMRDIVRKIKALVKWIDEVKAILNAPPVPAPIDFINEYYEARRANAYSQKGKVVNLQEYSKVVSYITSHNLRTMDDLASHIEQMSTDIEAVKTSMKTEAARSKELKDLLQWAKFYAEFKPVNDQLNAIHFKGKRERFAQEHERELNLYRMSKRKLGSVCPIGETLPVKAWKQELVDLERQHEVEYAQYRQMYDKAKTLWKIKDIVDQGMKKQTVIEVQREKTRHDLER